MVSEINSDKKILKSKYLSKSKSVGKSTVKLEDKKKRPLRKAVSGEIKRISKQLLNAEDAKSSQLKPKQVKASVKAGNQRQKAGASVVKKAVVSEINQKGEKIGQVLHPIKARSKLTSAASGRIGKKATASKKNKPSEADMKKLQKKTMGELSQLVSPTSGPRVLKTKLNVKSLKQRVGAEAIKAVNVREINKLGSKVGTVLSSNSSSKSPKKKAAASPRKK